MRRIWSFAAVLVIAAVLPAAAQAETHTFLKLGHLFPSGPSFLSGPANVYPSSVTVSGLSGDSHQRDRERDQLLVREPG
jgi:hypothetical protein